MTCHEIGENHTSPSSIPSPVFSPGITETLIAYISKTYEEPEWMLAMRKQAFEYFLSSHIPTWGPKLDALSLETIYYFSQSQGVKLTNTREQVPEHIKQTFEALGIPEAEQKILAGVGTQYDTQPVYHHLKKKRKEQGVIFEDLSHALKNPEYASLIQKYFGKCVSYKEHFFSALHYSVWSGGTFLYVPKNTYIEEPLQSYFRMNREGSGQFEHTLIILEEGSSVHYIEGCSAPKYNTPSLHAGCVEIFVGKNAHMRYSSVENWSMNTYNLNTKRAIVEEHGHITWVGGNLGSCVTMLYPCSVLKGNYSSAEHLGIAYAKEGQHQDTGAKVIHLGAHTSSEVISKSLAQGGGITTYRGLVKMLPQATNSQSKVQCDSLLLDSLSKSDAIPTIEVHNATSTVAYEAWAGNINEEHLLYLTSRGIPTEKATSLLVNGFISPILKELPLEYGTEINILISQELTGSF